MKTFKFILFIGLLSAFSIACSDGGRRNIGGRYCTNKQDTGFVTPPTAQKLSLKSDALEMPEGYYKLDRVDLLYVHKREASNRDTWIFLQMQENPTGRIVNENGVDVYETKLSRYCARGLSPNSANISASATGIAEMAFRSRKDILFKPKTYSLNWNSRSDFLDVSSQELDVESAAELSGPDEVFAGKATEYEFYKLNAVAADRRYIISAAYDVPEDKNATIYYKVIYRLFLLTDNLQPPFVGMLSDILKPPVIVPPFIN